MIEARTYQGKTIGVFGLARTGVAAAEALIASGAEVWAWDDNTERTASAPFDTVNLHTANFNDLDALLLAPGVPLTHPEPHALVKKAQEADVRIISDFDVFEGGRKDLPAHQTVAITGTNGKSTTTALITHMIAECGKPSVMGGNIGTGVLTLDPMPEGGVYVFEMSSFQLDITSDFRPDISVLLNMTPDHLDRHGDMDGYAKAKGRIFEIQDKNAKAVISVDDEYSRSFAKQYSDRTIPVSVKVILDNGISVQNGVLHDRLDDNHQNYNLLDAKTLVGEHNHQNAAATYAVGRLLRFDGAAIVNSFASFPGLTHRQELVAELDGVRFINDSKGTNPDAAARALDAFTHIHWIAGGRAKGALGNSLKDHLSAVKHAYLIGESADELAGLIGDKVPCDMSGTLKAAIAAAKENAASGDVILLSPACTAFDQFQNFEDRGDAFKAIVKEYGGQNQ
ncbi:UDP-N-acetylmuramoyl-L-alanine--D-glutamate ligase [Kordiimonas sp. SCSIO 12610]|uniref:UDP-N-acetylmuramoyl-L-alanine--D-glutamate ligase n=1 Tax=Kordiimonas sp. SCSIO 12610 TaxID=2829597 RepID=UPI0021093F5C|nr:UDP-N-acetylmuramoyl-L-alanine--D-glutamate ligase [Kordiimonas sp. SCSIO 12610]UTW56408.1 UDP-N-acetylmuramoyl-L-alanine--D-glutamate ligase [Kordiimonas sp. SCSIO 12610]